MDDMSDNNQLVRQLAKLEERMNTMQAKYEGALDRLRADMAAGREADAKRDKANIQWIVGTVAAAAILIIAVLGFLLRWPAQ